MVTIPKIWGRPIATLLATDLSKENTCQNRLNTPGPLIILNSLQVWEKQNSSGCFQPWRAMWKICVYQSLLFPLLLVHMTYRLLAIQGVALGQHEQHEPFEVLVLISVHSAQTELLGHGLQHMQLQTLDLESILFKIYIDQHVMLCANYPVTTKY